MEGQYYEHLLELKEAGEITEIVLQPHMELVPKYEKYGNKYRHIVYTPDFYVEYANGTHEYIELKGYSTTDAMLRRRLFDYFYPKDDLRWITGIHQVHHRFTEWRDYDEVQRERKERKKAKDKLKKEAEVN